MGIFDFFYPVVSEKVDKIDETINDKTDKTDKPIETVKSIPGFLGKFDPEKLGKDPIIWVIGRRQCGKSNLVNDLILKMGYKEEDVYWQSNEYTNLNYDKLPDKNLEKDLVKFFQERNLKVGRNTICNFLNKLKDDPCDVIAEVVQGRKPRENPISKLIVDETVGLTKKSVSRDKVFATGRHMKLGLILVSQSVYMMPPLLRDNIDYIFLFPTMEKKELKRLYENHALCIPTFETFQSLMNSLGRYSCLVIDKCSCSKDWMDKVFFYNTDNVVMGYKNSYKSYNRPSCFAESDSDSSDTEFLTTIAPRKKIPIVISSKI